MSPFSFHPLCRLILLGLLTLDLGAAQAAQLQRQFADSIQPLLKRYCLDCHSTEKHKGDLDLERFATFAEVLKHPKIWQNVVEQLSLGEMPPAEKPQPAAAEKEQLLAWIDAALHEAALARAGDPGPVVLRRLSNAEYTYTIRDLTGVPSLDPAREFPADSASGEGFMNVGNSLVMSPSLVTKYLDAAKAITSHLVLLPDGVRFSPSVTRRDWTEESLAAIRSFYNRYTIPGGGSAVNLQGIKFDTRDGGVLPLVKYLEATLELRDKGTSGSELAGQTATLAAERGLSAQYLGLLWKALQQTNDSLLLNPLRQQWRAANPAGAAALAAHISQWQQALWRFTQVGHIGKRDGPKAWQVPVVPVASAREVRLKLPTPAEGQKEVIFYLATSDAGDGNEHDFAVWENPRLVAPGRPDLWLGDVQAAVDILESSREKVFASAGACLAAASEATGELNEARIAQLAARHGVEPRILAAWLGSLGIGAGEARIDSHLTQKTESLQGYDFIKGWTAPDALSVIANSSGQHVRVPGNMKPRSVAVHPSPTLRILIGWRSPAQTTLTIEGQVQHAHPECGNGVAWGLELRRGNTRQRLAAGTAQGSKAVSFGPFPNVNVRPGDILSVVIAPRDGNHSCDLTAVDLNLSDGTSQWNLAHDVSPNILAGNPHADSLGNSGVWHFYSEPDKGGGAEPALPAGSLLARWQSSGGSAEKEQLARELQNLLRKGIDGLPKDSPDAILYQQLTSPYGPLLSALWRGKPGDSAPATVQRASPRWGIDRAQFGKHPPTPTPNHTPTLPPNSLCVKAPSVIEVRAPADLAAGCEFVATARLDTTGAEGSVQMQALATRPAQVPTLTAAASREQGGKSTWSDGERPVISDSPILVNDQSAARRRIEAGFEEFRQLFPAALCYTKIVPVDEVVTLTLYYREDDHLKRLMLNEAERAEIDRLWAELHYISQDALQLVDAFEQLWQYATQDADPSAFEPLREPIKQRAAAFRSLLAETQPRHVDAVLDWADRAYRRPLASEEKAELRRLYENLRAQELPHEEAVRLTLARILVSPAFLYRLEQPGPGYLPEPVNDWELATRLSYFLWSSLPDDELRAAAAGGKLQNPAKLAGQARRMLRDRRVRRLATEFACAWLHIYDFDQLSEKSERHFPSFTQLRGPMYEESIRFFTDLFQRDGSTLGILDADYAIVNAELAAHYGIPEAVFRSAQAVEGADWRRVEGIKKFSRGGILAQAAVLARQSGASRTSPILRGNWLCEVLLGDKLPRPPKDVPQLPEDEATETLTVRQLTEKHASDPKCYGCHRRIDPYGYSLEAFDAIGRFRDRDLGGRPIDTRAKVLDGAEFEGLDGLRQYLLTKRRDAFLRQFCRKLLGYALGRSVLISDNPLISEMQAELARQNYRVGAAVEMIVRSKQFREIRGRKMAADD